MANKKPAADFFSHVKRHNYFGTEPVERSAKQFALGGMRALRQVRATNKMTVSLQPADQRIACLEFKLVSFGKTPQPSQ